PEPGVVQDPLSPSPPDNAMDGGAQQSSFREPPGPGSTEQDERDGGEGPPELKRSQPLFIHGSSRQPPEEESRASSLPSIPNPFPELCSPSNSPILSSTALGQGPLREGATHVVKVFGEDGACRSLEAAAGTTARQLCETLVRRTRALQDHSWALVELHQHLGLERCLEDHELVVEVQSSWPPGADTRFVFRKNFAKYELFRSNASLFPEVMVSSCLEANKSMAHSELIQVWSHCARMCCVPPLCGRNPTMPLGTQPCPSGPHHAIGDPAMPFGTPPCHWGPCHAIRDPAMPLGTLPCPWGPCHAIGDPAMPLGTLPCPSGPHHAYGMQLYRNYQQEQARLSQPPWIGPTPLRSVSDNALVAMDFSGCTGRVIENPSEVLSVALEEAQAWRKKTTHRYSLPAACHSSPLSAAIHRTQPWFHGRISREDTQQLIGRQGLVDG
ncbi:GRB10 protein, partial [Eolophus roseicapillus]|nr:GRB10 protein [Eolophus roseicapilla]